MASAPLPAPQATPYWPPLQIGGVAIDLTHLEPFQITCTCPNVTRALVVDVRFTNHCFTDHFVDGLHDPAWKIMDHQRERVFCHTRHALSLSLPAMVQALPGANVHQTRHERNFVYAVTLADQTGAQYTMFFQVKRDRTKARDIEMIVESAYAMPSTMWKETLREAPKVKFATVCSHVFRNKPLVFRRRE
ncbi:hypothetical protein [Methylobacterium sp. Gmos1]